MKKITQIVICLLSSAAFAQPVINSTDFDYINYAYNSKYGSSTTLNQGAEGANVTWNFSSIDLTTSVDSPGTQENVAVGPFSSSFPLSNYVIKVDQNYYAYLNKTSAKIEVLGGSSNTSIDYFYINPDTYLIFPFSFNMTFNDTNQENENTPVISKSTTYDAYGTLITPFATYTNVIRLKFIENGGTSYSWVKINPYQELLSTDSDGTGTTSFSFTEWISLSVNDFSKTHLDIYPNPASSILNIKLSDNSEIDTITITDLSGKKILEQNGNKTFINMES